MHLDRNTQQRVTVKRVLARDFAIMLADLELRLRRSPCRVCKALHKLLVLDAHCDEHIEQGRELPRALDRRHAASDVVGQLELGELRWQQLQQTRWKRPMALHNRMRNGLVERFALFLPFRDRQMESMTKGES